MKSIQNKWIVLCILLAIIASVMYNFHLAKVNTFSKERWDQYPNKRWMILDSLEETHKIVGLSRNEVIELLGTESAYMNTQEEIQYYISSGIGDPEFLVIYFDERNIAYKYEIYVS